MSFSIQGRFGSCDVQWVYCTAKGSDFVGTFRWNVLSEPNLMTQEIVTILLRNVGANLYIQDGQSQKGSIKIVAAIVVVVVVVKVK